MSVAQSTKDAVEAATRSCERVKERAKTVSNAISNRSTRARTHPFVKVDEGEFKEDDSMVTSIEKVINSNASIELKKE